MLKSFFTVLLNTIFTFILYIRFMGYLFRFTTFTIFMMYTDLMGQFNILTPSINDATHPISDTIYMSPSGNDGNTGTLTKPVLSFSKALSLLPFGKPGIQNGHAYGLIIMQAGTYIAPIGFSQYLGDWKNGNTYKNVSIEGIGKVIIMGPKDSSAGNHLLFLRGDHIYVKNLTLRNGKVHGLLMAGDADRHCHDIRIENIDTDSVGGFGLLIKNGEKIEISGCNIMRSAQLNSENLKSLCNWPSGLKLLGCKNFRVHHCRVGYSRGEGLNYQNSLNGEAYSNILHDNTSNYYNENSKNIIIRNNYFYNSIEGQNKYWRRCPADTGLKRSPCAILLANEGSCHNITTGGTFENCSIKCATPFTTTEYYPTIDSIFIYNNVMQDVGSALDFWEGSTQIPGINCIKNVFFFNNTSIGYLGYSNSQHPIINAQFPYYNPIINTYSRLENIKIWNNIFSVDKVVYPNLRGYVAVFSPLHPSTSVIDFSGNLWNYGFSNKTATDSINTSIPGSIPPVSNNQFSAIVPSKTNSALRQYSKAFVHTPTIDFYGKPRSSGTNVGAFEYDPTLNIPFSKHALSLVYPNPSDGTFQVQGYTNTVYLYNSTGSKIAQISAVGGTYSVPAEMADGVYWIKAGAFTIPMQLLRTLR